MPIIDTPFLETLSRFLDVNAARHQLIVSNLANIDTPHYHTRDVDFRQEMERATSGFQYASEHPAVREVRGLMERPDGNNVDMDKELLSMSNNTMQFETLTDFVSASLRQLRLAITGRES